MSTPDALLNPLTPLAFLTPEEAYQVRVAIYVLVAPLAVSTPKEAYIRDCWKLNDHLSDLRLGFRK